MGVGGSIHCWGKIEVKPTYDVWDIVPGRNVDGRIEAVIDDWEGFRVLFRDYDTDRIIRIFFDSRLAFLGRDESDVVGEAARSEGLGRGCFYRARNSEFAARFIADTARHYDLIEHYLIVTDTDCVDVLTTKPPHITLL